MQEATHFIADNFARTRNMLEAIASGKPVVTTQWLESINQVNIYVDEDLYILRDSKKEKEFCFNMGVSLARARQYPLLQVSNALLVHFLFSFTSLVFHSWLIGLTLPQGKRVFITPNTKPGITTITTLVKAVHGVVLISSPFYSFAHIKTENSIHKFVFPKLTHTENKFQPVERLGRSALSEDKVPENLLVLSCEEDHNICIPFLERG